jgi:hypothetical protein
LKNGAIYINNGFGQMCNITSNSKKQAIYNMNGSGHKSLPSGQNPLSPLFPKTKQFHILNGSGQKNKMTSIFQNLTIFVII